MPANHATANQSGEQGVLLPTHLAFFNKIRPKKLISQIGHGYLVAISVGWVSSMLGIVIADYFQGKAVFELLDAQAQTRLLIEFEETANDVQLQGLRALVRANDEAALSTADADLAALTQKREEFEDFLASQPTWLVQGAESLPILLANYEAALRQQQTQVRQAIANGVDAESAARVLANDGDVSLGRLQQDLNNTIRLAQAQETIAANMMESAQGLEKLIVISSITLAGALAGLIAWRTTRAIATPLENITQTARRVTQNADYSLQAQVFSDDEVGTLARSLNALIAQVAERTQALEQAAENAIAQKAELEKTLSALKKAQLQLVQSEKMSSLGQLVAGIAHEVNNPIGFIQGNLDYVRDYSDALFAVIDFLQSQTHLSDADLEAILDDIDIGFMRQDFPKVLQTMRNGTERISSLIVSLKVFSRLQESTIKLADLNDGLESSLLLLGHRLKAQAQRPAIKVVKALGSLPKIECFSSQLNQVFMNIMTNALDAIDARWAAEPHDWQPEMTVLSQLQNDAIHIEIENNGLPISPAVKPKIFDPFFTTKTIGAGVGLGLSVSYEIVVEKHHGQLTCQSPIAAPWGARFCITIPVPSSNHPSTH